VTVGVVLFAVAARVEHDKASDKEIMLNIMEGHSIRNAWQLKAMADDWFAANANQPPCSVYDVGKVTGTSIHYLAEISLDNPFIGESFYLEDRATAVANNRKPLPGDIYFDCEVTDSTAVWAIRPYGRDARPLSILISKRWINGHEPIAPKRNTLSMWGAL